MAWEEYTTGRPLSNNKTVTVTDKGQISFNKKSPILELIDIDKPITVFYDTEKNRIGLRTSNKNDLCKYKITKNERGVVISCTKLKTKVKLPKETARCPWNVESKANLISIQLPVEE